jgi:cell wall-associated NlpC family hydrolase
MRVLLIVVAALSTACAATTARPQPFPTAGRPPESGTSTAGVDNATGATGTSVGRSGYEVSGTALALRGTPYRNGGADPNGFDCSGFVWYVFAQHGLALPRVVEDQFQVGTKIDPADLQPGDLVFFSTVTRGASHVGIAIGGDSFVHAPSSTGVVRVERLSASYWASRFIGAKRVL